MGSRFDLHTVIPFLPEVFGLVLGQVPFFARGRRARAQQSFRSRGLVVVRDFVVLDFMGNTGIVRVLQAFSDEMGGIRQHFHRLWAVCGVVSRIAFQKYCGEIANFIFNKCEHFVGSRYLLIYSSTVGLCLVLDWWLEKRKSTKLH